MRTPKSDPWRGAQIDGEPDGEDYLAGTVIEETFNPDHQGFIGFIPPKDGPMHDIHKTAKRIAAELVLLPRDRRGDQDYDEEYLKKTSGCRSWTRLVCAHCDCWKRTREFCG